MKSITKPGLTQHAHRGRGRVIAVACAATFIVGMTACGGDDDDASGESTDTPAATSAPAATDVAVDGLAEACAVATEMDQQESLPTGDQLTRYMEAAPDDIADAVNAAAPPLIAAGDDMVAFFAAFAADDLEDAIAAINVWESENCGIDHTGDPGGPPPEGSSWEMEDEATRVDVVSTDYAFDLDAQQSAGRTSFVLTNEGAEAHFLLIMRLAEGVTLDEMMAAEDADGMVDGEWSSGLAAPGGDDEEALTLDLEPGTYGALCFLPGPDGTPHAFMGMMQEFTVS